MEIDGLEVGELLAKLRGSRASVLFQLSRLASGLFEKSCEISFLLS